MNLTKEEEAILDGQQGSTLQKVMRTLVFYGEALEAEKFVDIEWDGHFSIPSAVPGLGPRLEMLDELVMAGLKTKFPFTLDPRSPAPADFENLSLSSEQERIFIEMLENQPAYDKLMLQLGLRHQDDYTCTPYLPEVDNIPPRGAILAWSESSCVVFANSVLGARTNRNSSIIDILSNIAGKTPLTGLLTDEGRQAAWHVEIKTRRKPDPQLIGAIIGKTVQEDVPYITGLDRFLNPDLDDKTRDYLKEMGAACAAIGAVGLYHVENITPEAKDKGIGLLNPGHRSCVVDDRELETMLMSYKVMWNNQNVKPRKCLIGCPHLSLRELYLWTDNIQKALEVEEKKQLEVATIICAAPQILRKFKADKEAFERLERTGAKLSGICPEGYMGNQICAGEGVITNSNKLRAFTSARLLLDRDLIKVMVTGKTGRN
jgi:predicted aconitase